MPTGDSWQELPSKIINTGDVGIGVFGSLSYHRLPAPLLTLSVHKLDGSSFGVQIARTAHVRDLKIAVENVFVDKPGVEGIYISWSHVWSHFCLSYNGEKLIDDGVTLRSLRIRDGDQLYFIRHFSINISPRKRHHGSEPERKRLHELEPESKRRRTMTAPEFEENGVNSNVTKADQSPASDEKLLIHEESKTDPGHKEFGLSHILRGFFSFSVSPRSGKTSSESRAHRSRIGSKYKNHRGRAILNS